jgi:hypothetical protein
MTEARTKNQLARLAERGSMGLALLTFGGMPFVPAVAANWLPGSREERMVLGIYLMLPVTAFLLALLACSLRKDDRRPRESLAVPNRGDRAGDSFSASGCTLCDSRHLSNR